jgi:RimJ/RimL family protein N-acetyltransferase
VDPVDGVSLTPIRETDHDPLRAIHAEPSVVARWPVPPGHGDEYWLGAADEVMFTIRVDGEIAGLVQFGEDDDPGYRHASIDIFIGERFQGRGVATNVLRQLVRHLFDDRGHHRLTIDPAVDNAPAIRCYEKVGFRSVGVLRQAEINADGVGWHDVLLMDLLRDEFRAVVD